MVATATPWSRSPASTGPGLLYELTTTLSKLNLNIASAHVATFGERVVDVFYVTDLPRRADHGADPADRDQAAAAGAVYAPQAERRKKRPVRFPVAEVPQ